MGGKKKYINIFGSFTEHFNCNTWTCKYLASYCNKWARDLTVWHEGLWAVLKSLYAYCRPCMLQLSQQCLWWQSHSLVSD